MFNLFKEKCPVCKMKLEKEKDYPKENGKKFCSESCMNRYKEKLSNKQLHIHDKGSCH